MLFINILYFIILRLKLNFFQFFNFFPFGNQGPRVWRKGGEAHRPSCMKSSVKFPQSVMIWGAMSSAGVFFLFFFFQFFNFDMKMLIFNSFLLLR